MKTIHFIPLFLLLAVICCNDDDDEPTPAPIVGIWEGIQSDVQVNYGAVPVYTETDDDFNVTLEFRDDGSAIFTDVSNGTVTTGTYSLDGNRLITNVDLLVYGVSGPTTFNVDELTDDRLHLRLNEDREVTVPDFGNVEVNIVASLRFNRK